MQEITNHSLKIMIVSPQKPKNKPDVPPHLVEVYAEFLKNWAIIPRSQRYAMIWAYINEHNLELKQHNIERTVSGWEFHLTVMEVTKAVAEKCKLRLDALTSNGSGSVLRQVNHLAGGDASVKSLSLSNLSFNGNKVL